MALSVGVVYVDVLPEMDKFGRQLGRGTTGAAGGAGKSAGRRFGGAFLAPLKGIGTAFAGIFAAKAVIGGFKSIVNEASDLGESINAVQVTFGDAADEVLKLGENAATSVGLSKNEFNGLAVQFGAFAKTIAGPGGDVAGTLDDLTTRAADFASVMNLDVADAAGLFQSGLAGETEPLRKFGIDLSAAAVESYAYANGIAAAGEELTENQKVQARYGSLLEQTAQTQGDFANTSGSLANQQRILGAEWDNLKATLGSAIVPLVANLLQAFSRFLPTIKGVANTISQNFGPALYKIGNFLKPVLAQFKSGGSTLSGFGATFSTLAEAVKGFVAAILPTLQSIGQQVLAVLVPALSNIWNIIQTQLVPAFANFLTAARPIANFLLQIFGSAVINALKGALQFIQGALQTISGVLNLFAAIFKGDWSKAWQAVKQIGSGIWKAIQGAFKVFINVGIGKVFGLGVQLITKAAVALWNFLRKSFSSGMAAVRKLVSSGLSAIGRFFSNAVSAIGRTVVRIIEFVTRPFRRAFDSARRTAKSGLDSIVRFVGRGITRVIDFFRKLPGKVIGAIRGLPGKLTGVGRDMIQGLINGAKQMAGRLVSAVKGVVDGAVRAAKNLLGIGSPSKVFAEFGVNMGEGMIGGMSAISGKVAAAASKMAGATLTPMQRAAKELLGHIKSGGDVFEDLTFRGASDNLGKFNDQLAKKFYATGQPATKENLAKFLRQITATSRGRSRGANGITVLIDGRNLDRSLLEWLRKAVRVQGGGSVQIALGQGR